MKPFDLLIFDWDGTLADSPAQIVAGMQEAIAALGLPPRDDRAIGELIGLGMVDGMQRLYPGEDVPAMLRRLADYRRDNPAKAPVAPLFAGARPALRTLHAEGYRLAVATGKHRDGLTRSFAEHPDVVPLFSHSRCANEAADKPHPLMLEQLLDETGFSAGRALMIGDTEYDIAMAVAANMPALGVATGMHSVSRLRDAGACAVLEDISDLPHWLSARQA